MTRQHVPLRPAQENASNSATPTLSVASAPWFVNVFAVGAQVEAITLDVGSTLIQCWPSVGHIYSEVAAEYGHANVSPEDLNRQFRQAWRKFQNFRHTREQWAKLVDAAFQGLLDVPPSRTFFPELYHRFSEAGAWRIFVDVMPALAAAKQRGYRLGVVSNWDDRLRPLLQQLGLFHIFDSITISCEVGEPKPAPAIFRAAAQALGLKPGNILHVGDDPVNDFKGAKAAGYQALLLQREAPHSHRGTIQSLEALADRLIAPDSVSAQPP